MAVTPTILSLDEAVSEIAQACAFATAEKRTSPFAFLVGAGISHPTVPLAGGVEAQCKEVAEKRGVKPPPGNPSPMERYSYWFGKAYPHAIQRQKYLQSLIEGKPISLANFRLAHLLSAKCVANLVITPNFDNLLSRALTTFGHDTFRVCDHPGTVDRITQTRPEVQIVHVHGNHWSYDQANLSGELMDRSDLSVSTTLTMALLLDAIFRELSPIVVGYSGWEGDVIMKALFRRASAGYKSFWFCHRRSDIDTLPPWLKSRQDVVFILPPETSPADRSALSQSTSAAAGANMAELSKKGPPLRLRQEPGAEIAGRSEQLEAHTVFDHLIVELKAEAPPLFGDPLEFFARRLEESVPTDIRTPAGAAAYSFGGVIEQIRNAQKSLEAAKKTASKAREAEKLLDKVRDAVRRSRYEDALKAALRITADDLGETELRSLVESLSIATKSVDADCAGKMPGLDLLIRSAVTLSGSSTDLQLDLTIADALIDKGAALWKLDHIEEAIGVYEKLVRRFGDSADDELQERVAWALHNKGVTMRKLNRSKEAVVVCDEIIFRFGDASSASLQEEVAQALISKGITLGVLHRGEEEISAYDEVVRRFGDSPVAALQERVANALFNKGFALGTLNRGEEAISAYDELVRRFGDSPVSAVQEWVALALYNKGVRMGTLNRGEEAISAYDELVRRFGDSPVAAVQEWVALALYNKGVEMGKLNRIEEELRVYDEVAGRFGDSSVAVLQERVANALYNKGFTLGQLSRNEEAIRVYDEVVRRFGDSPVAAAQKWVAKALLKKSFVLGESSHNEEAIRVYDEIVRRFRDSPVAAVQEQVAKALLKKSFALGNLNHDDQAVESYLTALRDKEGLSNTGLFFFFLLELSDARFKLERYDSAIEFASRAIGLAPDDHRGYSQRAGAHWYSEQYAQAFDDYSKVIQLRPQSSDGLNGRGHVLAEMAKYKEAIRDLDQAITLSADEPIMQAYVRNGRALAYAGLGEYARALEEFENSLRLCPNNAWVYYNRGLAHEWMGEHGKALADFATALEKNDPKLIPLKRARVKGWLEPSKV
jgi:tetratricopeptide (TPR) repeat protein